MSSSPISQSNPIVKHSFYFRAAAEREEREKEMGKKAYRPHKTAQYLEEYQLQINRELAGVDALSGDEEHNGMQQVSVFSQM